MNDHTPRPVSRGHAWWRQWVGWVVAGCGLLLLLILRGQGCQESSPPPPPPHEAPPGSAAVAPTTSQVQASPEQIEFQRHINRIAPDRIEVTVRIGYSGDQPVTALGVVEDLPPGWAFDQAGGDPAPQIAPPPGRMGRLEFAWITTPPFPFSFTYLLQRKPDAPDSDAPIRGQAVYRRLGGEEHSAETVTPLP
ncbi:MAG TPA: hypothetical protein PK349_11355 [Candidatus Hydrogenedentes bacterium]|nr:hypothetical protein [Candidatus Hydrogenedentota bacterium]